MNRRVLVTGASGFIGARALRPLAAAGFEVIATSRRPVTEPDVAWVRLDMLDADSVAAAIHDIRPAAILHCAWTVEHGRFWTAPENLDWAAVTLRMARAAVEAGCGRIVGVGTCAEYDWSDQGATPRRESDPCAPATLYGASKDATRRALAPFLAQEGVGFAWARVFNLFGPDEAPGRFARSLVEALREGRPALCRKGGLVRDFLSVDEAGAALAALVASPLDGPVNLGSGVAMMLGEVARALGAAAGRPELVIVQSEPAGPGEPARMLPDLTRLRMEAGFPGGGEHALRAALAAMAEDRPH